MRWTCLAVGVLASVAWVTGETPRSGDTMPGNTPLNIAGAAGGDLLREALVPKNWIMEQHAGAVAVLSNADNALRVKVERPGTSDWHVQMYMVPPELKAPGRYTLEFVMRADAPRKIPFAVTRHAPPYSGYVGTAIAVDTGWKRYKVKFTLKELLPGLTRVPVFHVGNTTGAIWIRSMSLTGPEPVE